MVGSADGWKIGASWKNENTILETFFPTKKQEDKRQSNYIRCHFFLCISMQINMPRDFSDPTCYAGIQLFVSACVIK